jgi:hypothetical protein
LPRPDQPEAVSGWFRSASRAAVSASRPKHCSCRGGTNRANAEHPLGCAHVVQRKSSTQSRNALISGGDGRNRTGVHGFAIRCVTTPPRRRAPRSLGIAGKAVKARSPGAGSATAFLFFLFSASFRSSSFRHCGGGVDGRPVLGHEGVEVVVAVHPQVVGSGEVVEADLAVSPGHRLVDR